MTADEPRPTGLSLAALRDTFFTPRRPVEWLSPPQLLRTGLRVGLASGIGAYLDKRELQNSFSEDPLIEDERRSELWFDYVADTGDGFNATYAVAYSLGQDKLTLGDEVLPRGQLLVMGGDEVYPTPSPEDYDDRLRGPFRAALPDVPPGQPRPSVYALPGNHDWYDGLTAFFRVFAGMTTTIGAWTTKQKRSYFAIKLPNTWWLFAVDAQQGAHIDDPQLEYFHKIIHECLEPGDRIILCTPEPAWAKGKNEPDAYRATDYFLRKVIDRSGQARWLQEAYKDSGKPTPAPKDITLPLMISGDWHHYSRYELRSDEADRRTLITAGGGGAYLLGTQYLPRTIVTPPVDLAPSQTNPPAVTRTYRRRRRFPSAGRSFWLGLGAPIRLPWRNLGFVALLGALQILMQYARDRADDQITIGVVGVVALAFGLTFFLASGLGASSTPKIVVLILATIHTVAQWFGVRAIMGLLIPYWQPTATKPAGAVDFTNATDVWQHARFYLEWAGWYGAYGVIAGLASAIIVGLYLVLAALIRVNINELFSSQRIEGYKNFLRLHIAPSGELTVYAIGIKRARRWLPGIRALHWKANPNGQPWEPWFTPRRKLKYKLIEKITISG